MIATIRNVDLGIDHMFRYRNFLPALAESGILLARRTCSLVLLPGPAGRWFAWQERSGRSFSMSQSMGQGRFVVPPIYDDHSDQGRGYFQFSFRCPECNYEVMTSTQRSTTATATRAMDLGVGLLRGFWDARLSRARRCLARAGRRNTIRRW